MSKGDKRGAVFRAETLLQEAMKVPPGKCSSDTNPDAWFPEIIGRGRTSKARGRALAVETKRAVGICNTCPAKQECLEAGMDPLNLPFGIWGGTLPPERIAATGKNYSRYSDEGIAMYSMQGLKQYFIEVGMEVNW